jgi:hypothetical protein
MRRFAPILGVTGLVVLAGACGTNGTQHLDGAAAPVGHASSSFSPTPAVSASETPATSPASSSPPPSRPARPTHTDPVDLTIYPDHIGPLKIGMSLTAAKATGLIDVDPDQADPGPAGCTSAHWRDQVSNIWMIFNGRYGLRAIDSFGNQKTPEGIRPGSTLAAVRSAYPHLTWRIDGDETPDAKRTSGDALVDAVKGDGAHYRINIQNRKVTDVQLESDRDGCYE